MFTEMTTEEYRKTVDKPKKPKYNNTKVKVGVLTFDSQAEADEYQRLLLRQRAGQISKLQVHPTYTLVDGFRTSDGVWVRPIKYEADFSYIENNREIAVDVKGVVTQVFQLKKKLFFKAYPNIRLVIVTVKR